MRILLTPEDVAAGDAAAAYATRSWWIYLLCGIVDVIFGFVILSFRIETIWALALFIGFLFVALGIIQIAAAFGATAWKWLYVVAGVCSIGVGIVSWVWPQATLLVISILIAWVLLVWGIADVISSLGSRHYIHYWWAYLIRGIVSIGLGLWAAAHPTNTLVVFVTVVGIWAVVYGVIEIFASFQMKHADRAWEATKADLAL